MGARYVNTDLIVRSRTDRPRLARALEVRWAIAIDAPRRLRGMWHVAFETRRSFGTAKASLERLLRAVEDLGPKQRAEWDACATREFDIGYEGEADAFSFESPIPADLLRRIVAVGGSLRVTIYRSEVRSGPESKPDMLAVSRDGSAIRQHGSFAPIVHRPDAARRRP